MRAWARTIAFADERPAGSRAQWRPRNREPFDLRTSALPTIPGTLPPSIEWFKAAIRAGGAAPLLAHGRDKGGASENLTVNQVMDHQSTPSARPAWV